MCEATEWIACHNARKDLYTGSRRVSFFRDYMGKELSMGLDCSNDIVDAILLCFIVGFICETLIKSFVQ